MQPLGDIIATGYMSSHPKVFDEYSCYAAPMFRAFILFSILVMSQCCKSIFVWFQFYFIAEKVRFLIERYITRTTFR